MSFNDNTDYKKNRSICFEGDSNEYQTIMGQKKNWSRDILKIGIICGRYLASKRVYCIWNTLRQRLIVENIIEK